MTIIVLGGTGNANALTEKIAGKISDKIIYCLAGVTSRPRLPKAPWVTIRSSGFSTGGGFEKFLLENSVRAVIEALHPFAANMRASAISACRHLSIPLLQLEQKPWAPELGDLWTVVQSVEGVLPLMLRQKLSRPFIALGRKNSLLTLLDSMLVHKFQALARVIEPMSVSKKYEKCLKIICQNPPYSLRDELKLLESCSCDCVITRNGGQKMARNKCYAAAKLGIPVIMVEEPHAWSAPINAMKQSKIILELRKIYMIK